MENYDNSGSISKIYVFNQKEENSLIQGLTRPGPAQLLKSNETGSIQGDMTVDGRFLTTAVLNTVSSHS